MEEGQSNLFAENVFLVNNKSRKALLPWWIKVFIWIFLIFGILASFALIFALLGAQFELSLYGLETTRPFSLIGIAIIIIFVFKGLTAYSLLTQRNYAITLGIIDAISGIVICSFIMISPLINQAESQNFTFRLELIALIPYLLYIQKIKSKWENPLQD